MPKAITPANVRFWRFVDRTATCWNWTGGKSEGYGMFKVSTGVMRGAHRYSYEMHTGAIPAGLKIDHICQNKLCVRPSHLRAVTNKQNLEHQSQKSSKGRAGVRGVVWNGMLGKWMSQVRHNGKLHIGGYFNSIKEAGEDAVRLRNALFTHNDLDRPAHASTPQPTVPTEAS